MADKYKIAKNIYGAIAVAYPVYDSTKQGFREPNWLTKYYLKRSDYKLSDEFIDIFDGELVKQVPRNRVTQIPIRFSTSEAIDPKVWGLFWIRQGADFEFPSRTLIKDSKEFRERFKVIRQGAGVPDIADGFIDKIPDEEIRPALLTDDAKRFMSRRLIMSADTYQDVAAPYLICCPLFMLFYPVVHFGCAFLGPVFSVFLASGLALGLLSPAQKLYNSSRAFALDKKVYSLGEEYAVGCRDYLKASLSFGKLMNKLTRFDRGNVFTPEGNVHSSSAVPYSVRMILSRILCQRVKTKIKVPKSFWSQLNTEEWIFSKWGTRFRLGLSTVIVAAYPVAHLIYNGPLLDYVYNKKPFSTEIPDYLQRIINEEYESWLTENGRKSEDAVVKFRLQNQMEGVDTIASGSTSVRFGGQIVLPFYARFRTQEDVIEYCRQKLEPLFVGQKCACIIWESELGQKLINTFLLSENALRFLIYRDIERRNGHQTYFNKALSWATFTVFSNMLAYYVHRRRKQPSTINFVVISLLCNALFILCAMEWHKSYIYMADGHADILSAEKSNRCRGGIEYYMKLLRRNQLLRDVIENGSDDFTLVGDKKGIITSYVVRLGLLRDKVVEHEGLDTAIAGDD